MKRKVKPKMKVLFFALIVFIAVIIAVIIRVKINTSHLEMESYGISNTRKNQIFLYFCSVVNDN